MLVDPSPTEAPPTASAMASSIPDVETEDEDAFMSFDETDDAPPPSPSSKPYDAASLASTSSTSSAATSRPIPFSTQQNPQPSALSPSASSQATIRPSFFARSATGSPSRTAGSLMPPLPPTTPRPATTPSNPQILPVIHDSNDVPEFFLNRPYITISVGDPAFASAEDLQDDDDDDDDDDDATSSSDVEPKRIATPSPPPQPATSPPPARGRAGKLPASASITPPRSPAAETDPLLGTGIAQRSYSNRSSPETSPRRRGAAGRGARKKAKRLGSLDVFRGGVVIAMILANFQIPSHAFSWMLHAEWIGLTPVDLIFPAFLFAMGLSIPLALHVRNRSYLSLLHRSVQLFLIGVLLNDPISLFVFKGSLGELRYFGVLQRIAVVYLVCAVAYKALPWLLFQVLVPLTSLTLWLYLTFHTPPTATDPTTGQPCAHAGMFTPPECTAQSRYDLVLLGGRAHTYRHLPYDPEGFLSTLTALLPCWAGAVLGVSLLRTLQPDRTDGDWRQRLVRGAAGSAVVAGAAGIVVERFGLPMSKPLWTPSFACVATGCAMAGFAAAFGVVDLEPGRWGNALRRRRSRPLRHHHHHQHHHHHHQHGEHGSGDPEPQPRGTATLRHRSASSRPHAPATPASLAATVLASLAAVGRNPLLLYVLSSAIEILLWWTDPRGGSGGRDPLAMVLFRGLGFELLPGGVSSLAWSAAWAVGVVVPVA
ncbi:hypothetical protein HDU96_000609, partial [Phlyctochytrium bullatum]